ncbi:ABC transporter ATP-binding protein [Geochorda subterranea]|uniref:ABC transporter ATP-binding protein n=1 Tax=Geochorda subterranea TaxID=3109564 RepID=A0ABZ1BPD6_9FIRM|nr:ABC transporter ATP-binding protein [Limnochorda sp. LNt]WRP14418.1 ABC transporter ATP-binding protein [Limnochorda sp. LNt]
MALLEVQDLQAGYHDVPILHGLAMRVAEGELVAIVGPNGAGKSTLMKALFGLVRVIAGSVRLDGQEITHLPPERRVPLGLSYVPQVDNVFASLTVEENLEMGAYLAPYEVRPRMEQVLELFPLLRRRLRQRVGTMSGGERQMVAMGRALMLRPRLLLLDEPSAGLAPSMVDALFAQVQAIRRSGVAIVMVEQNARRSLEIADRGYVLASGRTRFEGRGADLASDPEVARLYLGG